MKNASYDQTREKKVRKALGNFHEHLIHSPVCSPELLPWVLAFFTPDRLEEVVIDRSQHNRCGNLSCSNPPSKDLNGGRKWKIVFGSRKVIDASMSYHFCTEKCFNEHLQRSDSLSTESPHLRYDETETQKMITLIETRKFSKPTKEAPNIPLTKIAEDLEYISSSKNTDMKGRLDNFEIEAERHLKDRIKQMSDSKRIVQFDYKTIQKDLSKEAVTLSAPQVIKTSRFDDTEKEAELSEEEEDKEDELIAYEDLFENGKLSLKKITNADSIFDFLTSDEEISEGDDSSNDEDEDP